MYTFNVGISYGFLIDYQWQKFANGSWVNVGTNIAILKINNIALSDTTFYRVKLLNRATRDTVATSQTARLDIPHISTQPVGGEYGTTLSVSVVDKSDHTTTYQWYKDNHPLPGETGATCSTAGTGKGAGNYYVAVTLACETNSINSSTVSVTRKTITTTTGTFSKVYDGNTNAAPTVPYALSGIVAGDESNVSLNASDFTYDNANAGTGKAISAGTWTLTGTAAGNYSLPAFSAAGTITQAPLSLTFNPDIKTYTGNNIDITPAQLKGVIGSVSMPVSYSYNKGGVITTQARNAGSYTVTVTVTGDTNHAGTSATATLTVNKATPVITLTSVSSQYTGNPIPVNIPVVTGSTTAAALPLVIKYEGTGATVYPETTQAPTGYGEYKVTVSTAGDANHNAASATSTISIGQTAPAMNISDANKIYDGTPLQVAATIVPATLTINYSYAGILKDGTVYPATATPPTDAGDYTVTASTPGDVNYSPAQVTAVLTIEKASQTITFNLPATKQMGDAPFDANASVNTGLTLAYQSGNTDIATIDNTGLITILKSGVVTITVSQAGNGNYLPASETHTLNITSNDATIHSLTINGTNIPISDNMHYDAGCNDVKDFNVIITTEANATVNTGRLFTVMADKPQLKTVIITVTSQDGTQTKTYVLTIECRFLFEQIVQIRWNNTLTAINNPANNGGYRFTSYKWFRNGQEIGTGQSWSAGANGEQLNPADMYYVEVTSADFAGTLRTCETGISLRSMSVTAYPNPVSAGQTLYIEADVDDELLKDAVIEVYNVSGNRVGQLKVQSRLTPVDIRYAAGIHFFVLKGKDGFEKDLKVVVQ